MAMERDGCHTTRSHKGDRRGYVLRLLGDDEGVVVALPATGEVEGERGDARLGERRSQPIEPATRGLVRAEPVGHHDATRARAAASPQMADEGEPACVRERHTIGPHALRTARVS